MKDLFYLFLFLSFITRRSTLFYHVDGFPTQAGACFGDKPAVSGLHIDNETSSKSITVISDWNEDFRLRVNDVDVTSSSSPVALVREGSYIFSIDAINSTDSSYDFFRGILIRIQQENGTFSFDPIDRNAQNALACVGSDVIGITHTDNTPKSSMSGLFQTWNEANVTVDVTIVIANTDAESIYGYKQYTLQVFPPDSDNELTPTRSPAPSMTMQPTFADYCNVCAIEDIVDTNTAAATIRIPENMITLAGKSISCGNLQEIAKRQLLPMSLCEKAQSLVRSQCGGCNNTSITVEQTLEPTNITVSPTPVLPTYCRVCPWGMDLVRPDSMVRTSGTTCREFADSSISINSSSATCNLYRKTIETDCGGCQATMAPTLAPTALRRFDTTNPTSSIASNDKNENDNIDSNTSNNSGQPNLPSSITSSTGLPRLPGIGILGWMKLVIMESVVIAVMIIVQI